MKHFSFFALPFLSLAVVGAVSALPSTARAQETSVAPAAANATDAQKAQAAEAFRMRLAPGPVRLGPDGKPLQPTPAQMQAAHQQESQQISRVTLFVLHHNLTKIQKDGANFKAQTPLQQMLAGLPEATQQELLKAVDTTLAANHEGQHHGHDHQQSR